MQPGFSYRSFLQESNFCQGLTLSSKVWKRFLLDLEIEDSLECLRAYKKKCFNSNLQSKN